MGITIVQQMLSRQSDIIFLTESQYQTLQIKNEKSSYVQLCYNLASPKLLHLVVVSYSQMFPIVRSNHIRNIQSYFLFLQSKLLLVSRQTCKLHLTRESKPRKLCVENASPISIILRDVEVEGGGQKAENKTQIFKQVDFTMQISKH